MIRVLVVDDHPVVPEGIVTVLSEDPELDVVDAAATAQHAVEAVGETQPDVVLLDLELPDTPGVNVISSLKQRAAGTRVLVFTAYETEERVLAAIRAGAAGYLLKGATSEELTRAIKVVASGGSYLEPAAARRVMAEVTSERRYRRLLSVREREVLELIATGQSNKQIARDLYITERTVKFHVGSILHKLGAANRAQAVALATERGLL